MSDPSADVVTLAQGARDLTGSKYFQLASYIMLVYDHLLTFGDEVERIWQRPMSGASFLYLLNRYGSFLEITVVLVAFNSPAWTNNSSACEHFVRFEGWGTTTMVLICEAVMILRVYALWNRNIFVLCSLSAVWLIQLAFAAFSMAHTSRAMLPPGFIGCILAGDGPNFVPFWSMPMITDMLIFILTIIRTRRARFGGDTPLVTTFRRDGMLYFLCIFTANLINTFFYTLAREDLKAVGATFSQLITSVMISRLVLSLRGVPTRRTVDYSISGSHSSAPTRRTWWSTAGGDVTSTILGNLGEDVENQEDEHHPRPNEGSRFGISVGRGSFSHPSDEVELRSMYMSRSRSGSLGKDCVL